MSSVSIETAEQAPSMDPNLFEAAAEGNLERFKDMARDVIERLSTAHTKNTILHINIISQKRKKVSTEFVEEILETCPSLLLQVNAKSDTPLHVAAKFGHSDIVSALIERAKLAQHGDEDPERGVEAARQMIRMVNNEKNTALHEATVCPKNIDVVKILTREDTDYPYSANTYGQTPLYMAAAYGSSDMVVHLVENCKSMSHEGPDGRTALHAAVLHFRSTFGNRRLKKVLEKKKSLIKETDQYGWTPIHYAAYHNRYREIHLLLELDRTAANIADKDRKMTALHLAAGRGHARIVKTILSLTPQCYDLVDNRGWNFLHYAMVSFYFFELKDLLKNPLARSLIGEGDTNGNTPLHVGAAVIRGVFKRQIIKETEANYHAVNNRHVSVEHMLNYGHPELKDEIQKLSTDVGRGQYSSGVILKERDFPEDISKEAKASHLVVAALIATVAFAAAFAIPGGYKSENGTAILRRKTAFQAFMVSDSIAMIFSLAAVFALFWSSLRTEAPHLWMTLKSETIRKANAYLFNASIWFTIISMGAMVIAFVTGTYAMLGSSLGLAIITCLIGLSFFLLMYYVMVRGIAE